MIIVEVVVNHCGSLNERLASKIKSRIDRIRLRRSTVHVIIDIVLYISVVEVYNYESTAITKPYVKMGHTKMGHDQRAHCTGEIMDSVWRVGRLPLPRSRFNFRRSGTDIDTATIAVLSVVPRILD